MMSLYNLYTLAQREYIQPEHLYNGHTAETSCLSSKSSYLRVDDSLLDGRLPSAIHTPFSSSRAFFSLSKYSLYFFAFSTASFNSVKAGDSFM